jgi:hypothetical protein
MAPTSIGMFIARLDAEINESTFQADFEAIAYPSAATSPFEPNICALTRFIETRAIAKAYKTIITQKFVQRMYDDDRRLNVAHDVAVATVDVLKNKLASGDLTDSGAPVRSLGALITTIVIGKHRDIQKKGRTVPTAIERLGPIAVDLFYQAAVQGMDLDLAEEIAIQRKPGDAAFIRGTVVPAILKVLQNPSAKADYQYHTPRAAEDLVLERGSVISGAPRRSPEEELLRNVKIETIRRAVEALPSPRREIAEAMYLSPDPPTEKDLARRLGIKDVGYEKKKIKKELMSRLSEMFRDN